MQYYYHKNGEQVGPIELEELLKAPLEPETLVWQEGLPNWKPAKEFPELSQLFAPEMTYAHQKPEPPQAPQEANSCSSQKEHRNYASLLTTTPPPSYLPWAILVTIFCCWPLGIPAIVYASKVGKYFAMKEYLLAKKCSNLARNWMIASIVVGFVAVIIWFILIFTGTLAGLTFFDNLDLGDYDYN